MSSFFANLFFRFKALRSSVSSSNASGCDKGAKILPKKKRRSPVCSAVRLAAQNEQLCIYLRPRTRSHSYDRKGKRDHATKNDWINGINSVALPSLQRRRFAASPRRTIRSHSTCVKYCPTMFQCYDLSLDLNLSKHPCLMQWKSYVAPSQQDFTSQGAMYASNTQPRPSATAQITTSVEPGGAP